MCSPFLWDDISCTQKKRKSCSLTAMPDTPKARDSPLPSPKQSRWFYWPATGDFTKHSDGAVQYKTSSVATNSDADATPLQLYAVTRAHVLLYHTNYIFKEQHRPRNVLTLMADKVTVDINGGEAWGGWETFPSCGMFTGTYFFPYWVVVQWIQCLNV